MRWTRTRRCGSMYCSWPGQDPTRNTGPGFLSCVIVSRRFFAKSPVPWRYIYRRYSNAMVPSPGHNPPLPSPSLNPSSSTRYLSLKLGFPLLLLFLSFRLRNLDVLGSDCLPDLTRPDMVSFLGFVVMVDHCWCDVLLFFVLCVICESDGGRTMRCVTLLFRCPFLSRAYCVWCECIRLACRIYWRWLLFECDL